MADMFDRLMDFIRRPLSALLVRSRIANFIQSHDERARALLLTFQVVVHTAAAFDFGLGRPVLLSLFRRDNAHEFLSACAGHACPSKEDEVLHFQHTTPRGRRGLSSEERRMYEARPRPMLYDLIADVHSSSSNSQAHARRHVRVSADSRMMAPAVTIHISRSIAAL